MQVLAPEVSATTRPPGIVSLLILTITCIEAMALHINMYLYVGIHLHIDVYPHIHICVVICIVTYESILWKHLLIKQGMLQSLICVLPHSTRLSIVHTSMYLYIYKLLCEIHVMAPKSAIPMVVALDTKLCYIPHVINNLLIDDDLTPWEQHNIIFVSKIRNNQDWST